MTQTCTLCGRHYPDNFDTCTCRFCGGLIEPVYSTYLNHSRYAYDQMWKEWQAKYAAAPPIVLSYDAWLQSCAFFNNCAICGGNIEESLLVVPPYLGGKRYIYNVLPSCEICAKRIRQSQQNNPIRSFYTIKGSIKANVDLAFKYLEAQMLQCTLEFFNYDEDSLEIVITCTEDTSTKPFNGIYAKRLFKEDNHIFVPKYISDRIEEVTGVTWRLLDE